MGLLRIAAIVLFFCVDCSSLSAQQFHRNSALIQDAKSSQPQLDVVLPMKFRGPMPAVDVKVNGKGPFLFALDTGAQGMARADSTLVKQLALPVVDSIQTGDGSGKNNTEMKVVRIDSLQVGDAKFSDVDAPSRDYNRSALPKISGMLGIHLFKDHLLTLDFEEQEIRFRKGKLPEPDGKTVFKLHEARNEMLVMELDLGGKKQHFHLDSGNTVAGITIPEEIAKSLSFEDPLVQIGSAKSVSNVLTLKQGQMGSSFFIGDHEFSKPIVSTVDIDVPCNLGLNVLTQFEITIDQKNKRVQFLRQKEGPISLRRPMTLGLGLGYSGDNLIVASVVPGSSAEKAGVKAGDQILDINGMSVASIERAQLGSILKSGVMMKFKLKRIDEDSKTEELEISVMPEVVGKKK